MTQARMNDLTAHPWVASLEMEPGTVTMTTMTAMRAMCYVTSTVGDVQFLKWPQS